MSQATKQANALLHETSPYLKQHAYNPVAWYPWGPEALARAKELDRPIFLSVGYSACHWCHVMEHESFEDPEIAGILNDNFVSIKVDREERPDLDQIYMMAVQRLNHGQGGWPMSVFLLLTCNPFSAGLTTHRKTPMGGLAFAGCFCCWQMPGRSAVRRLATCQGTWPTSCARPGACILKEVN